MIEILWYGRGGQGAFTAARLLGAAFSLRGGTNYALAFPSFGPERRGAPIRAFTKLDTKPIGNRSEIAKADYILFLDDTLFTEKTYRDLKPGGRILLNTKKEVSDDRIVAFDGDALAEEILRRPITNTIMLGAFAAVSGTVSLKNIEEAIRGSMPAKLQERNISAVQAAAKAVEGGRADETVLA